MAAMVLQVSAHIRRIEAVEKDLKALRDASATKEDISRVRGEMKKLYDGLHVGKVPSCTYAKEISLLKSTMSLPTEFLDLRSHVWGIRECPTWSHDGSTNFAHLLFFLEQDLHSLSKKESTSVRIV